MDAASYDSRAEANLRIGGESNLPEVLICLLAASWLYRDAGQPFQEATVSSCALVTPLMCRITDGSPLSCCIVFASIPTHYLVHKKAPQARSPPTRPSYGPPRPRRAAQNAVGGA